MYTFTLSIKSHGEHADIEHDVQTPSLDEAVRYYQDRMDLSRSDITDNLSVAW